MNWEDFLVRESEDERAEEEMEQLLNAVIPFAQRMLAKHGEFYPFAAAVKNDGRLKFIGDLPKLPNPLSEDLIDHLREQLISGASQGEYRATGICSDVRVAVSGQEDKSDAVCISLEHLDGQSMNVFLPYRLAQSGEITYGDVFASIANPVVFLKGLND